MTRSFGIVEDKLREADFFLGKLCKSPRLSADARYYFSAFISSSRTVTLSMQACLGGLEEFDSWYKGVSDRLKTDHLAKYFLKTRNESTHVGVNPLNHVPHEHLREHITQQLKNRSHSHVFVIPSQDDPASTEIINAVEACEKYFVTLVTVVFECYETFKTLIDPRWYLTEENFRLHGKSFVDAVVEQGFPTIWASYIPEGADGWEILRSQEPCCLINDIFIKYLGCCINAPASLAVLPKRESI